MPKIITRTQFGNPVLRQKAKELSAEEILSDRIQMLINNMRHTLKERKYGIALAAPQVGHNICLSVIRIRPTRTRPNLPKDKWADLVIINPKIVKAYGLKKPVWEGCISLAEVFAKANKNVSHGRQFERRFFQRQVYGAKPSPHAANIFGGVGKRL